jgi:hypothetical protein
MQSRRQPVNATINDIMDLEKEAEWQEIQQQLDRDYKNKMKLVNDEALKKL